MGWKRLKFHIISLIDMAAFQKR